MSAQCSLAITTILQHQSQLAHGRDIRHVCKREINGMHHREQLRHETPQVPLLTLTLSPSKPNIRIAFAVKLVQLPAPPYTLQERGPDTQLGTMLCSSQLPLSKLLTTNQSKMCQPRQQTGIPLSLTVKGKQR